METTYIRLESLTYDSSKHPATFTQHFIVNELNRGSLNTIGIK